jgi:ABC-type sugar transport system permease subunit
MLKKRHLTAEQKYNLEGYKFVLPWIIGFILFFAYPFFTSLILSFGKVTDVASFKIKFVGWQNYVKAFVVDVDFVPKFLETVRNTLIDTPVILIYSLFIAILLNKDLKGKGFFRAVFFLPVLLGTGLVMKQLLGTQLDKELLQAVTGKGETEGIQTMAGAISVPKLFTTYLSPDASKIIQNIFNRLSFILWMSGIQILIFMGGLQGVPNELYESAYCDGASNWEMFWKITLPMITPSILLNVVYTLIDSFTNVDNKLMEYTLKIAFKNMDFGFGAAMGWIFFLFIGLVVGLVFLILGRFVVYLGDR